MKIYRDITKFFHLLTLRNWGWPYHVMLAGGGFALGVLILLHFSFHLNRAFFISAAVVNMIGLINELFQDGTFVETLEDILGNVLGTVTTYFILQAFLWQMIAAK